MWSCATSLVSWRRNLLPREFEGLAKLAAETHRRAAREVVGYRVRSSDGCCVISTDSLCGDYPGEWFVAVGFREEAVAQLLADTLNAKAGEHAVRFYRVVPANYELQPGFEP